MMITTGWGFRVALVTATLSAACSLMPSDSTGGQQPIGTDGVLAWAQREPANPDELGMLAGVTGRVEIHRGCVVLTQDESTERFPVVWPAGTTLLSVGPLVIDTSSGQVREGDIVHGGGGYLRPGALSSLTVDIPRECLPRTNEVAVFNPTEAIEIETGDDHP